jgi:hypothetical protein
MSEMFRDGGMMSMMFHDGGMVMFTMLYLAVPLLGLAVTHAAVAARWSVIPVVALLAVIFAAGLVTTMRGRSRTEEAVRMVDASMVDEIRAAGYAEASPPTDLAILIACAVAVPIAIGETRRLTRPRRGA